MNEVTKFEQMAPDYSRPMSAIEIRAQVNLIQEVLREVMQLGVHFGYVPGTEPKTEEEKKLRKPALFKAGAEKLGVVLRLDPQFEETLTYEEMHLTVLSKCTLFYIPNGRRVANAAGMCSTRESKYAYRWALRGCPVCGQETIIKGRAEYGGGWICFKKKGGCGEKFEDADERIVSQAAGRIANPDLPDQWNTVLKMAAKRSHVAAILFGTAASDIFGQDIEELPEEDDYAPGKTQRPEVKVEQPTKRTSGPADGGAANGQGSPAGAGEASGPFKAMIPQMKKMVEGKLQHAGLTKVDLEAHFKKKLDAIDETGFAFHDFADIEKWISQNRKG